MTHADPLVSAAWLKAHLHDPGLRILDCSWFMPGAPRNADAEFAARHIPGAVRFDFDRICDPDDPLPHMLPSPEAFARDVGALGIDNAARIVCYADEGLHSAGRVWWMFRTMGHDAVSVLDGGLKAWLAADGPVAAGEPAPVPGLFVPRFRKALVRSYDEVAALLQDGSAQLIDVRAADRFRGEGVDPRPWLRKGHMPGALNAPYTELVADDGTMKPDAALREALSRGKVDLDRPAVTSCGSGVTATVTALAMAKLGYWETAVYDGSWTDWGEREDSPIVTGPP